MTERLTGSNSRSLVGIASSRVARGVVFGGRKYADWLPYNRHTMPRAEAFLAGGRPFSELLQSDRNFLDDLTTLRNALAHESSHALRQFRRAYTDGRPIAPQQHRPPAYLRGQHALGQRRFEYLLSEATGVMRRLCK